MHIIIRLRWCLSTGNKLAIRPVQWPAFQVAMPCHWCEWCLKMCYRWTKSRSKNAPSESCFFRNRFRSTPTWSLKGEPKKLLSKRMVTNITLTAWKKDWVYLWYPLISGPNSMSHSWGWISILSNHVDTSTACCSNPKMDRSSMPWAQHFVSAKALASQCCSRAA